MARKVQKRHSARESRARGVIEKAKLELVSLWQLYTNSSIGKLSYLDAKHSDMSYLIRVSTEKRREFVLDKEKLDGFIEGFNRWERKYRNLVVLETVKRS